MRRRSPAPLLGVKCIFPSLLILLSLGEASLNNTTIIEDLTSDSGSNLIKQRTAQITISPQRSAAQNYLFNLQYPRCSIRRCRTSCAWACCSRRMSRCLKAASDSVRAPARFRWRSTALTASNYCRARAGGYGR